MTNFTFPTPQVRNTLTFKVASTLPIECLDFDISTGDFVITLCEPLGWSKEEYVGTDFEDCKCFGIGFFALEKFMRDRVLTIENVPVSVFEDGVFLGNLKAIIDQEYVEINGRKELCRSITFFLHTPSQITTEERMERVGRVMRVVKPYESYLIWR